MSQHRSRGLAAALALLALAGCSSVDLDGLKTRQDLAEAREQLKTSGVGDEGALCLAVSAGGLKVGDWDSAHPDHYGMQPEVELLAGETQAILEGAFARVDRHDPASERAALDLAFEKGDRFLLDVKVARWDAAFVRKNGWWYPNAFFLAWYFYPFASWMIADQVYGVQAALDWEILAARSGRRVASGRTSVDSRAVEQTDGGERARGPLVDLDGIDRGIDIPGTYGPGDLTREQWAEHIQPLLEPYARREAAKALARDVGAALRRFEQRPRSEREAVTAAVHAVIVGVGRGENNEVCEFAAEDAAAIASCLGTGARVVTLKDGQASREAVLRALEAAAAKAEAEDSLVFYFAGRGTRGRSAGLAGLGLACAGAERAAGWPEPPRGVLTLAEVAKVLAQSRSQKPVLLLDASFAGGPRGFEDAAAAPLDLKDLLDPIARERGALLVACQPPEKAHVLRPAKHGLFTYALVQGLSGAADAGEGVTWDALARHVVRTVTPLAELDGEAARPIVVLHDPAGLVPR